MKLSAVQQRTSDRDEGRIVTETNDHGQASPVEMHREMLRKMVLIRRTEERILQEYRLTNITGAIHLSIGQEAVPVGVCSVLRKDDCVYSTHRGTDQVSVSFFSDGAANQGTFHESLNLAALWKLPVVFVCENNRYAATTPVLRSSATQDISSRAGAYGIPGTSVDGNDVSAVYRAAQTAVLEARSGGGPTLLECRTYRIEPHCGIIPDQRVPGERENWRRKDPIERLKKRMVNGDELTEQEIEQVESSVLAQIDEAVSFALKSPLPDACDPRHNSWMVK